MPLKSAHDRRILVRKPQREVADGDEACGCGPAQTVELHGGLNRDSEVLERWLSSPRARVSSGDTDGSIRKSVECDQATRWALRRKLPSSPVDPARSV